MKSALDVKETARNDAQIDRAIESASRSVEGLLHRVFYPTFSATKYFSWPNWQSVPWTLWLQGTELISVDTLVSGGITIPSGDYFLEPNEYGPPYDRIEINRDSTSAFSSGSTPQRSIAVTGTWGYQDVTIPAPATQVTVTAAEAAVLPEQFGHGRCGRCRQDPTERLLVTGKSMRTVDAINTDMAANVSAVSFDVNNGAVFNEGEVLLIDSERMLIVDIAANTIIVKRAWDG